MATMPLPLVVLFGFALWTMTVPLGAIATYRWMNILQGARAIESFRADAPDGAGWYRRAMRAHANCVENLPVLGALVGIDTALHVHGALLDGAATTVLVARVPHTLVHILLPETSRAASLRFALFFVQYVAMLTMAVATIAALARP